MKVVLADICQIQSFSQTRGALDRHVFIFFFIIHFQRKTDGCGEKGFEEKFAASTLSLKQLSPVLKLSYPTHQIFPLTFRGSVRIYLRILLGDVTPTPQPIPVFLPLPGLPFPRRVSIDALSSLCHVSS